MPPPPCYAYLMPSLAIRRYWQKMFPPGVEEISRQTGTAQPPQAHAEGLRLPPPAFRAAAAAAAALAFSPSPVACATSPAIDLKQWRHTAYTDIINVGIDMSLQEQKHCLKSPLNMYRSIEQDIRIPSHGIMKNADMPTV